MASIIHYLKGKQKEIYDLQKLLQMPMMILLFYVYLCAFQKNIRYIKTCNASQSYGKWHTYAIP